MRIRAVRELQGNLDFEPQAAGFNWLSWLARLGLVMAGRHDVATAHLLAQAWQSVNRTYLAAERDTFKMFRYSTEGRAAAAATTGPSAAPAALLGAKRTGAGEAPKPKRIRCLKCGAWHPEDAKCKESDAAKKDGATA